MSLWQLTKINIKRNFKPFYIIFRKQMIAAFYNNNNNKPAT